MLVKKPFFPLFFSLINNFEVFKQVFRKKILVRMLVVQAKKEYKSLVILYSKVTLAAESGISLKKIMKKRTSVLLVKAKKKLTYFKSLFFSGINDGVTGIS